MDKNEPSASAATAADEKSRWTVAVVIALIVGD